MLKLKVKKIICSGRVTVVFWDDGTVTRVKCHADDKDSFETAMSAAIAKKILGNSRNRVVAFLGEALEVVQRPEYKKKKTKKQEKDAFDEVLDQVSEPDPEECRKEKPAASIEKKKKVPRSKTPTAPKVDRSMMMSLFKAGWPVTDVAIEFGVSEPTIRKVFIEHTGQTVQDWRRMNGIETRSPFNN